MLLAHFSSLVPFQMMPQSQLAIPNHRYASLSQLVLSMVVGPARLATSGSALICSATGMRANNSKPLIPIQGAWFSLESVSCLPLDPRPASLPASNYLGGRGGGAHWDGH